MQGRSSLGLKPGTRSAQRVAAGICRATPVAQEPISFAQLQAVAASRGLHLSARRVFLIGYEILCREGSEAGAIAGQTGGFLVPPLGLMHCDKMTIFSRRLKGERGAKAKHNIVGLGLIVALASFAYGREAGCKKAEMLAINDDDTTHARLVAYYARVFGFRKVRELTSGLADVPAMMLWGGLGTRMDAGTADMLLKWTPALLQELEAAATSPPQARSALQRP